MRNYCVLKQKKKYSLLDRIIPTHPPTLTIFHKVNSCVFLCWGSHKSLAGIYSSFTNSRILLVQCHAFISKAALLLEIDGCAHYRYLVDMWMTGKMMTDAEDDGGIFCWGDRKRGETSCMLYYRQHIRFIIPIRYLLSMNPLQGRHLWGSWCQCWRM